MAAWPLFCVVTLALYGPKIGLLDTSLLAGVMGIILLALLRARLRWPSSLTVPVLALLWLAAYALGVHVLTHSNDSYPILRVLRALIATSLLGVVVLGYPL